MLITGMILRGIGAGIALDLAKRGASVVVNYSSAKSADAGDAMVKRIEEHGGKASAVQASVTSPVGIEQIVKAATALSPSGKIDIIVHNAGHGDDRYLEDIDEKFYYTQTDINLKGELPETRTMDEIGRRKKAHLT